MRNNGVVRVCKGTGDLSRHSLEGNNLLCHMIKEVSEAYCYKFRMGTLH